jgi:hypothetical protein
MFVLVLGLLTAAPIKIAVVAPSVVDIDAAAADAWVDRVVTRSAATLRLVVIPPADVTEILGPERLEAFVACTEAACRVQAASTLAVDAILQSAFAKDGELIVASVRAVDAASGAIVMEQSQHAVDAAGVQTWLDSVVDDLETRLRPRLAVPPAVVEVTQPIGRVPWLIGAFAVSLGVGGSILLGLSAADSAQASKATSLSQMQALQQSSAIKQWSGVGLLVGTGLGLAAAFIVWMRIPDPRVSFFVAPTTDGAFAALGFHW